MKRYVYKVSNEVFYLLMLNGSSDRDTTLQGATFLLPKHDYEVGDYVTICSSDERITPQRTYWLTRVDKTIGSDPLNWLSVLTSDKIQVSGYYEDWTQLKDDVKAKIEVIEL